MTKEQLDFMDKAVVALLSNSEESSRSREDLWNFSEEVWNARPKLNTSFKGAKTRPLSGRFILPSYYEVQQYIEAKGYKNFTASQWFNHYEANGWKIGKSTMKNWQASVRTWGQKESDDKQKPIGFA